MTHTTVKLANALSGIPGVPPSMIRRAFGGYYHDFLTPLDFPELQLVADLLELASRPAIPRDSRALLRAMIRDVIDGEFDASAAEAREWAESDEGRDTIRAMQHLPGLPGRPA